MRHSLVTDKLLDRLERLVNHGEDWNEAFDEFVEAIPLLIAEIRELRQKIEEDEEIFQSADFWDRER